ncbi:serine/arginine repetitive matrix protein 1-like [Palaemon carinicauda]|uniref:serine/arginine repetitive matrix protein 1-like n=1 Tax=Palaemon carinicauda TaxID=392227 RepID=UPI0035B5763E
MEAFLHLTRVLRRCLFGSSSPQSAAEEPRRRSPALPATSLDLSADRSRSPTPARPADLPSPFLAADALWAPMHPVIKQATVPSGQKGLAHIVAKSLKHQVSPARQHSPAHQCAIAHKLSTVAVPETTHQRAPVSETLRKCSPVRRRSSVPQRSPARQHATARPYPDARHTRPQSPARPRSPTRQRSPLPTLAEVDPLSIVDVVVAGASDELSQTSATVADVAEGLAPPSEHPSRVELSPTVSPAEVFLHLTRVLRRCLFGSSSPQSAAEEPRRRSPSLSATSLDLSADRSRSPTPARPADLPSPFLAADTLWAPMHPVIKQATVPSGQKELAHIVAKSLKRQVSPASQHFPARQWAIARKLSTVAVPETMHQRAPVPETSRQRSPVCRRSLVPQRSPARQRATERPYPDACHARPQSPARPRSPTRQRSPTCQRSPVRPRSSDLSAGGKIPFSPARQRSSTRQQTLTRHQTLPARQHSPTRHRVQSPTRAPPVRPL